MQGKQTNYAPELLVVKNEYEILKTLAKTLRSHWALIELQPPKNQNRKEVKKLPKKYD